MQFSVIPLDDQGFGEIGNIVPLLHTCQFWHVYRYGTTMSAHDRSDLLKRTRSGCVYRVVAVWTL